MKQKRKRDAEEYQKVLKEQIEEKKRRIQSQNQTKVRIGLKNNLASQEAVKNPSNNTSVTCHDYSPAVTSSRYSNTNTA
jgi:hypothetical protein